ncbi:hypothetical protein FB45DRAFT_1078170 [Roridomyces roridus]|uniref:C2H2-type domain-containing protein n=1 Tax=Roridomyces roridus TaxID=1738132 RepID=A0AAD7CK76_9AGAR|nr:hypothetical protein FB45DRAFT_1078170 [Roridomyces roridus]
MSLTLPIQTLLTMQISLRIGSDGQIDSLEMGSVNPDALGGAPQLDGLKLHVQSAITDSSGVRLTMSASMERQPLCSLSPILEPTLVGAERFDLFSQITSGSFEFPGLFDPSQTLADRAELGLTAHKTNQFEAFPISSDLLLEDIPMGLADVGLQDGDAGIWLATCATTPDNDATPSPSDTTSCSEGIFSPVASESSDTSTNSPCLSTSEPEHGYKPKSHKPRHKLLPRHALFRKQSNQTRTRFPCTMGCVLAFSRRHDRLRHEVSQHGRPKQWECDLCAKFFSSQKTLEKHNMRCKERAK